MIKSSYRSEPVGGYGYMIARPFVPFWTDLPFKEHSCSLRRS